MTTPENSMASVQPETIAHYDLLIKERDLDTFGHMNNATYLTILEEARWDLITKRGYGLKKVQETKIGPIILEVSLKFKREIPNREQIKISTGVLKHSGKITTLRQVMYNAKGEEACVADFVVGLFDLKARKLIDYTPEWNKALGFTN